MTPEEIDDKDINRRSTALALKIVDLMEAEEHIEGPISYMVIMTALAKALAGTLHVQSKNNGLDPLQGAEAVNGMVRDMIIDTIRRSS
jgi:hypothetical protein